MAIVIEEEKNRGNLLRNIGWLILVVIIVAAAYYIFFAAPQLVIIAPTGNLSAIAPIAQNNLNPESILHEPGFQSALGVSRIRPGFHVNGWRATGPVHRPLIFLPVVESKYDR